MLNKNQNISEKRSESVAKTVESTLNDLKISIEPSMMEMKNVLLAEVSAACIKKMIDKSPSVRTPKVKDKNFFALYSKEFYDQVFYAALMLYHSENQMSDSLLEYYCFVPLAYKLAEQAYYSQKDLMSISTDLKREARMYKVPPYKKDEIIYRADFYSETITMGMVIYMLKTTQRVKTDFLFKIAIDCLEREYSEEIVGAPSFLPYISKAFLELANFVQTFENDSCLNKDTCVAQEQVVELGKDSYIPPTENVRNVFRFPSELLYECVSNMFEILKINKEKPSGASLALIEKVLEDHGQLYTCAEHTKFIKAVQDWGLIKNTNYVLTSITSAVKKKYSKLDRRGYLDFKNEKDKKKCLIVASCLKEDMKYIAQ